MSSINSKKRKRPPVVIHQALKPVDTTKPTGTFQKPGKGRIGTLSIALPGSIVSNAQTLELKSVLAGRVARAAAVFCVDEIVIFEDGSDSNSARENDPWSDPSGFLSLVLSFVECPPHLRKRLFPLHSSLRSAGLIPPLDLPHHIKPDEWCQYREGVTIGPVSKSYTGNGHGGLRPTKKQKKSFHDEQISSSQALTLVDTGFPTAVEADIPPHTRVTVKFPSEDSPKSFPFFSKSSEITTFTEPLAYGDAIDPAAPREEAGYYWGYDVRKASCLSKVFTECPFEDGYDVSIGTSERGEDISKILRRNSENPVPQAVSHALIVFGGLGGLEVAANADKELGEKGISSFNVADLFDYYVDVCPGQGSRTIRTEEALLIALGQLRNWISTSLQ